MHYPTNAFSNGRGPTIVVNNPSEYSNQSSPILGQSNALSARDIEQVNLLYECSDEDSITGRLRIKVRYAVNLPHGSMLQIHMLESLLSTLLWLQERHQSNQELRIQHGTN